MKISVHFNSSAERPLLRARSKQPQVAHMSFWINPNDQPWEATADIDLFCDYGEPDSYLDGDASLSINPKAKATEITALESDQEFIAMLVEVRKAGGLSQELKTKLEQHLDSKLGQRAVRAKYGVMPENPNLIAKVRGDAGKYPVLAIDWLNNRVMICRAQENEWFPINNVSLSNAPKGKAE